MSEAKHIPLKVGGLDIIAQLSIMPTGAMVAIRPICEAMGMDDKTQRRKLESDSRFTSGHMTSRDSLGRSQEMFCLPVEQIGPWLYSINSNKVKAEVREVLLQFQQHLTKELNAVIMGHISSQETAELKRQVALLAEQVRALTEIVMKQQEQINLHNVMAGQEQTLASVGGKLMSRAKATKYLRKVLHNQ